MKLPSQIIDQTATQIGGQVIPDDSPVFSQLNNLFGEHTFFLGSEGLHIIEPDEASTSGAPAGRIVRLAAWTDANRTTLAPHAPEPTGETVPLDAAA